MLYALIFRQQLDHQPRSLICDNMQSDQYLRKNTYNILWKMWNNIYFFGMGDF